jgi:hypothetical protein
MSVARFGETLVELTVTVPATMIVRQVIGFFAAACRSWRCGGSGSWPDLDAVTPAALFSLIIVATLCRIVEARQQSA